MHNKYAAQGLVVVSLNLDDPQDAKALTDVKDLLAANKMGGLVNVNLDEEQRFWKEKFGIAGVPCIFVFNRAGKWTRLLGIPQLQDDHGEIRHELLEAFVKELLSQPAK